MIGENAELAESDQTVGKLTKMEPLALTSFPRVMLIVSSLAV